MKLRLKKNLALLALAFGWHAIAATPIAVWDGDFSSANLTQGSVTMTLNGNTVSGGAVTIDQSLGVSFKSGNFNTVTAIVRGESLDLSSTANQVLMTVSQSDTLSCQVGVWLRPGNAGIGGIWGAKDWGSKYYASNAIPTGSRLALRYVSTGSGVRLHDISNGGWTEVYNQGSLKSKDYAYTTVTLGGSMTSSIDNISAATGWVIKGVALFDSELSQDEIQAYRFPSETTAFTATVNGTDVEWSPSAPTSFTETTALTYTGSGTVTLPEGHESCASVTVGSGIVARGVVPSCTRYEGEGTFVVSTSGTMTIPAGLTVAAEGDITLHLTNNGTFTVASGNVTVTGGQSVRGTVNVQEGATLTVGSTDLTPYDGNASIVFNVYGTLDFGVTRQTWLPTTKLNFYTGSTVKGYGNVNPTHLFQRCAIQLHNGDSTFAFKLKEGESSGSIQFDAVVSLQSGNATLDVEEGVTVNCGKVSYNGSERVPFFSEEGKALTKSGNGTVVITTDLAVPSTIAGGRLEFAAAEGETVTVSGLIGGSSGTLALTGDGTIALGAEHEFAGTYVVTAKTITLDSATLPLSSAYSQTLTSRIIAQSGTNYFKYGSSASTSVICSNDTKTDPFLTVKSGAVLEFNFKDLSGWAGSLVDTGWFAVESGATMRLMDHGGSRYFRNHLLLNPGATLESPSGSSYKLYLYGGVGSEETAQLYVPSGDGTATIAAGAGVVFGEPGYEGAAGCGVTVGSGATLDIQDVVTKASDYAVVKYGAGTLVLDNANNAIAGSITLKAGVIKSVTAIDVTTDVAGMVVQTASEDGYTVYSLREYVEPTAEIALGESVFGKNYATATVTVTVKADGDFDPAQATYTATTAEGSVTGTYDNGTVTFEGVKGTSGAPIDLTVSVTPSGADAAIATVTETLVFGVDTNWFLTTAERFEDDGKWTNAEVTSGTIVLSGDDAATFTPSTNMCGKIAEVGSVVTFDAPNDDESTDELDGAQTAFRLATKNGGVVFQLWEGGASAWVEVANANVTPATNATYAVTNAFNYADLTFTMSVNGQPMAADGRTTFSLPSGTKEVSDVLVLGSGSVTALAGNYFDNSVAEYDGKKYATVEEAVAAANGDDVTLTHSADIDAKGVIVPTAKNLNVKISNIAVYNVQNENIGTEIPLTTGRYYVKAYGETVADVGVVAAKKTETNETALVAVPFLGLDGEPVSVESVLNTALLADGNEAKVYDAETKTYDAWTWTNGAWQAVTTVTSGGSSTAPAASEKTLEPGSTLWVTTAGKIVVFGRYDAETEESEKTPEVPEADGTHLLGNLRLEALTLPDDFGDEGDRADVPGDASRYTRVPEGWERKYSVVTNVTIGGVSMPFKQDATAKGTKTARPVVPAGRGFFFRKGK